MAGNNRFLKTFALSLIFLASGGCGQKVTYIDLTITSGSVINPNDRDISYPLMLRFYELTEADKFSKLSFQALADEAAKQLGDNLISQAKHVVLRNKIQSYKIRFDDRAKYLGIIGSFRKLDENGTWRFVKNLEAGRHNELELLINRHSIKEDD